MEASLDPFFGALNRLNDQMQNDATTREELAGLGRFVEGQLEGTAFKGSEEEVVAEAKERFGRVRERLLSTCVVFFGGAAGEGGLGGDCWGVAKDHTSSSHTPFHAMRCSPLRRPDPPPAG